MSDSMDEREDRGKGPSGVNNTDSGQSASLANGITSLENPALPALTEQLRRSPADDMRQTAISFNEQNGKKNQWDHLAVPAHMLFAIVSLLDELAEKCKDEESYKRFVDFYPLAESAINRMGLNLAEMRPNYFQNLTEAHERADHTKTQLKDWLQKSGDLAADGILAVENVFLAWQQSGNVEEAYKNVTAYNEKMKERNKALGRNEKTQIVPYFEFKKLGDAKKNVGRNAGLLNGWALEMADAGIQVELFRWLEFLSKSRVAGIVSSSFEALEEKNNTQDSTDDLPSTGSPTTHDTDPPADDAAKNLPSTDKPTNDTASPANDAAKHIDDNDPSEVIRSGQSLYTDTSPELENGTIVKVRKTLGGFRAIVKRTEFPNLYVYVKDAQKNLAEMYKKSEFRCIIGEEIEVEIPQDTPLEEQDKARAALRVKRICKEGNLMAAFQPECRKRKNAERPTTCVIYWKKNETRYFVCGSEYSRHVTDGAKGVRMALERWDERHGRESWAEENKKDDYSKYGAKQLRRVKPEPAVDADTSA